MWLLPLLAEFDFPRSSRRLLVATAAAREFHLSRSDYMAATGRASPEVAITVQDTDMLVRRKGRGGAAPILDVREKLAWTLHALRTDLHSAHAEPVYAISDTVLGRVFQKTVVALDNLWPTLFPPMTYTQALELMPLSLITRLFCEGGTGVPVSACASSTLGGYHPEHAAATFL